METVGVRELRQRTSEIIRRVEEGETFVITRSGREVAELNPGQPRRAWREWDDIAATALAHGARLATANIDDLVHLADLVELIRWPAETPRSRSPRD